MVILYLLLLFLIVCFMLLRIITNICDLGLGWGLGLICVRDLRGMFISCLLLCCSRGGIGVRLLGRGMCTGLAGRIEVKSIFWGIA